MRLISLFLSCALLQSEQIQNINVKSCKNCIYFRPSLMKLDEESLYTFGKCEKFGRKDIVSGKIHYTFADLCRNDELKCGHKGKYFSKSKYAPIKTIGYKMVTLSYYAIVLLFIVFYFYSIIHT